MARSSSVPKTVIFLGAGASKAEGAPMQRELFKEYFEYYKTQHRQDHEWDHELSTFFEAFFGIDIDNQDLKSVPFPTFEEILGILEIADSQEESFRDWGTSYIPDGQQKPRIQHIHELLILLIAEVLDFKLKESFNHHKKLLENIQTQDPLEKTSFISLNYDILIDNALLNLHPQYDLDYHVEFSNFEQGNWHRPDSAKAILLLKLHGSLNWLYCPTCRVLELTPKEKKICNLKWKPEECLCKYCQSLAVPIVIPPTYFKALSNIYLRQVWDRAEKELMKADRIIFCGYSFPDADIHIKYLLKRAEINRNGNPPSIYIVNEHEDKTEPQREQEKERYHRFFRKKNQIHWTNLTFEQFAENPTCIEDSI